MTNYYNYYNMEKKELLQNNELILLIESLNYCEENNVQDIRYSELRRLCDRKLAELTNGERTEFGGSFESSLRKLSDTNTPRKSRFLTRVRSQISKKNTRIVPDIMLIKNFLDKRKVINSIKSMNSVTKQAIYHSKIAERSVEISDKVDNVVFRVNISDFLKDASRGISSVVESNLVNIYYTSTATNGNNEFQLNEKNKDRLLELTNDIAIQNKKHSFIITLEYKGIPTNVKELSKSDKISEFYQKLNTYFTEWAIRFDNYKLTEKDKNYLNNGKFELLTNSTRSKFKLFLSSLIDNNLKYNKSMPIILDLSSILSKQDNNNSKD